MHMVDDRLPADKCMVYWGAQPNSLAGTLSQAMTCWDISHALSFCATASPACGSSGNPNFPTAANGVTNKLLWSWPNYTGYNLDLNRIGTIHCIPAAGSTPIQLKVTMQVGYPIVSISGSTITMSSVAGLVIPALPAHQSIVLWTGNVLSQTLNAVSVSGNTITLRVRLPGLRRQRFGTRVLVVARQQWVAIPEARLILSLTFTMAITGRLFSIRIPPTLGTPEDLTFGFPEPGI